MIRLIVVVFVVMSSFNTFGNDTKLVPFLIKSKMLFDYNKQVVAQRNLIRDRRQEDQRRKFKGKFISWFKDRPHASYQRIMIEDAPVVVTTKELPDELVFYDLFPGLRKVSRVDYAQKREDDRMRFIDLDRHQIIDAETVFEETTGRYLDEDD